MRTRQATSDDLAALARLTWEHAVPGQQSEQTVEDFVVDLGQWWTAHADSHLAFVGYLDDDNIVGVAWLALFERVPRPGIPLRLTGDIQSVFVDPADRGQGLGSALVRAATATAVGLGAARVTVSSTASAVPVYERLGFAASPRLLQQMAGDVVTSA